MISLEHFRHLEHVGSALYIGFNAPLSRIELPRLRVVEGGIVVEANPNLVELRLPALERVGQSLSIRDNVRLEHVDLPALQIVGGDLSLVANRRLTAVRVATAAVPARAVRLEVVRCGLAVFPLAFVQAA